MEREKRITIRVPGELHRAVKIKVAQQDTSISEVIRVLLEEWLEEEPEKNKNKKE